ncbi:MAG: ribosome maturation factor RimM [Clostridia bacterium]
MDKYFEIGQIVNTNGLKGMLKVKPFTDDIKEFEEFGTIYIQKKTELIEFKIEAVKYAKQMVLLKLEGIDDINEAEKYRNLYLKVDRSKMPKLPEDSYYIVDLIDCKVVTIEGENLGKVDDVFSTGSNDVYVVKNELGKQILLPAIGEVIKNVDIPNKKITVKLMEGLV